MSHFMTSFWKGSNFKRGLTCFSFTQGNSCVQIFIYSCSRFSLYLMYRLTLQYFSCPLKNVLCLSASKLKEKNTNHKEKKKTNRRLLSTPRQLVAFGWCTSERLWGSYHLRSNGNFGSLAIFNLLLMLFLIPKITLRCFYAPSTHKGNFVHVTWEIKRIWTTVMCLYDM